jgi:hypothetical protein
LTVTNTADSGTGSLRQTIANAAAGDTIQFDSALFSTPQTINLTTSVPNNAPQIPSAVALLITKNLTIAGPGARLLTVRRNSTTAAFGIFAVTTIGTTVRISGMTVSNGNSGPGSAFDTEKGTLVLDGVAVTANPGSEGAIGNRGTTTIINSTISNNPCIGVFQDGGTVNIANSTISGNNDGNGLGGVIAFGGALNLNNVTVANNKPAGANNQGGTINVRNTIIAGNTTSGGSPADISGAFVSQGNNLIGNTTGGTGFTQTSDKTNVAANLTALANNGGPTNTHALNTGSPAINAGNNCVTSSSCGTNNPPASLATDQRGTGFSRNIGGTVDIGAFEFAPPATSPAVTTPTSANVTATSATLGGNVTSDGGAAVTERGVVYASTATNSDPQIGGTGVTKVTTSGTTGVFTVNVTGLSPNTGYTFKAYAINSGGTRYTSAATFTTVAANSAPTASASPNPATTNEDNAVQITLTGTDADDNNLTYTITDAPDNGTLTGQGAAPNCSAANTCTVVVTYTPNANSNGADSFSFTVNDGTLNSEPASVSITVNSVNDQPSFTASNPPPVLANSGPQTVPGFATFNPGPNESGQTVLAYSVSSVTNSGLFASAPSVSTSGTLSYTPAANAAGTSTFALTVQDNGGTANGGVDTSTSQTFTITVNQPPAITSANNTTFTVGTAGTFSVTTTGFPAPALSASGTLPSGVTFNAASGVLSGTPAAGTGGSYPLTFTASNGVGTEATQNFTLTVNQPLTFTSANSATFTVGTSGSFTVTTSGFPRPTITAGGASLPFNLTFVDNANGTATLSGMPAAAAGGVYNLTFTASNGAAAAGKGGAAEGTPGGTTQNFTLTVNEAPTITSANSAAFTVGNTASFAVTTTGFPAPTVTMTGALPTGVTFTAGTLGGTPAAGSAGNYPLTFTAANGVGSDHVQSFALTVNDAICTPVPANLVAWYPAEGNAIDVEGARNGMPLNGAGYANAKVGAGLHVQRHDGGGGSAERSRVGLRRDELHRPDVGELHRDLRQ